MLLNEFLKAHRTVQAQQKEIEALRAELKEQRELIQKVNDKVELNRPAPQTVLNDRRSRKARVGLSVAAALWATPRFAQRSDYRAIAVNRPYLRDC